MITLSLTAGDFCCNVDGFVWWACGQGVVEDVHQHAFEETAIGANHGEVV